MTTGFKVQSKPENILEKIKTMQSQQGDVLELLQQIFAGATMHRDHATKGDVAELRGELKEDVANLRGEIAELRTELKGEIAELRTELKGELKEGITQMHVAVERMKRETMRWVTGIIVFQTVSLFGLVVALVKI